MKAHLTIASALGFVVLAGCGKMPQLPPQLEARLVSFEQKAGPAIAKGCAVFHQAEGNQLVQVAVGVGAAAATAATGVPMGLVVSGIRTAGQVFCANGPPAGDTTTDAERAKWIEGVAAKLVDAAVAAVPTR